MDHFFYKLSQLIVDYSQSNRGEEMTKQEQKEQLFREMVSDLLKEKKKKNDAENNRN
jgi:hypothetical protein